MEDREELTLLNPFGEELMLLNPRHRARRRRNPRIRRRARTRVRLSFPRRRRPRVRRRRRALALFNDPRRRRRVRRNPVDRAARFRVADVPRYILGGLAGTIAGGAGFFASRFLPAEYDRTVLSYAVHGGVGTLVGILGAPLLRPVIGRAALPLMIGGAWTTVLFRMAVNHIFGAAKRPKPLFPPSEEAKAAGLEGIEEHLPMSYDFGQEDVEDMGQAYQTPEPYDVGQEYAPARSLPAASMPVGQEGRRFIGQAHQEAPELGQAYQTPEPYDVGETGVYSRRPVTHFSPLW